MTPPPTTPKRIEKIREIIENLYYKAIYMGRDIDRGQHDMFMGNNEARREYDQGSIDEALNKVISQVDRLHTIEEERNDTK